MWSFDSFDLAAGTLRARGQLAVAGRSVTGQVAAEVLPLPGISPRSPDPLPVRALRGWDGAVTLQADQVLVQQAPVLSALAADVSLANGALRLDRAGARLDGGALAGTLVLDASREPPSLAVTGTASGVAVSRPLWDAEVDVASGVMDVALDVQGAGYSPATLLATLGGTGTVTLRDGALRGLDLQAASAALHGTDPAAVLNERPRGACAAGPRPLERMDLRLQATRGVLALDGALSGPAGNVSVSGSLDVTGAGTELRFLLRPNAPDPPPGPELGLRVTGPVRSLVRTPELAGLSRWLADRQ